MIDPKEKRRKFWIFIISVVGFLLTAFGTVTMPTESTPPYVAIAMAICVATNGVLCVHFGADWAYCLEGDHHD